MDYEALSLFPRFLSLTLMDYEGVWLLPLFHSEGRSPLAPLSLCSVP